MKSVIINTPLGKTKIIGDKKGIAVIKVLDQEIPVSNTIPEELQLCAEEMHAYFNESIISFSFKLNPKGTEFQKKVWKALLEIPYGKTTSYLQLSKTIGNVKAIRAVANANGKNPIWIAIPCHRVIGSDGSLTGYAGGLHRKQWLLNHESPNKQQSLF